jgi:hypothetical protein
MFRRSLLVLAVGSVLALGSLIEAQTPRHTIPMGGTVVDLQGIPVGGADVFFNRRSTFASGGTTVEMVASARTDPQGGFSFGSVPLVTDLAFPLETAVRFDYEVRRQGEVRPLEEVTFSAPRKGTALASISASLRVR